MPQGSLQWQGTQRRACAPGAHWNVQVVRGKVTTRCLWHACKALGVGLLLMLLGACMATIGYYADQLSMAQEIRGNMTVQVKNESRGFHLNNLSYAGPIVMGFGGFIVVAACVMTFEARDSAAKVVPARFRFNQTSTIKQKSQRSRRSTSCQTSKWDHQLGLFRVNRSPSPSTHEISRKQLTAEFMQFSKTLQEKGVSHQIKKSPSAPTLFDKKSPRKKAPKYSGCALLNPELLQRHALSVDNPSYNPQQMSKENLEHLKINGSQASMAMDLHIPNKGPVTLKVKDRSDTARRHQLSRQTKIEDLEESDELKKTPKLPGAFCKYPDDFLPRKRNSIDLKLVEELCRDLGGRSPRDFRKMSFDRIGDRARLEKSASYRKASFEYRKSPDFRRYDYRKHSVERFSMDCAKYTLEDTEMRSRANSGESLRRSKQPKLYHSRSDENKRRSFEKYARDSQCSRFSLNVPSSRTEAMPEFELKYFTTASLGTDDGQTDKSDESHTIDIEDPVVLSAEISPEAGTLLEEPELEVENPDDVENVVVCSEPENPIEVEVSVENETDEGTSID